MRTWLPAVHPDGSVSLRYLLLVGLGVYAINEFDALEDSHEQTGSVETTPVFLGDPNQLEHHAQGGQA